MTGLLALALGWLLLVQGVPDVDVLWTADVATAGPGWLGRIAVCLLVALGAGPVAGGLVAVRRFRSGSRSRSRLSAPGASAARR